MTELFNPTDLAPTDFWIAVYCSHPVVMDTDKMGYWTMGLCTREQFLNGDFYKKYLELSGEKPIGRPPTEAENDG